MTTPRWLNEEEQALWRLILAASRKMDRCLDETLLAGNDLSTSEFAVLASLSESEAPGLRLRDLCSVLDWDRSRTSHQITRMEKRGLVTKESCEGDARGVIVVLTPEGNRRLESAAPDHVESVRRLIFDHLSREQSDVLEGFLEALLAVDNVPGAKGFDGRVSD